jgi:chromosome partitioning protein
MKTLAIICQKGGAGKTTLAIHMAVTAAADGRFCVLWDADPQGSALRWRDQRPADHPPPVLPGPPTPAHLADARDKGARLSIIDSPPAVDFRASRIIDSADFALIPVRPSPLDIAATRETARIVSATGTPAAFVLSACPTHPASSALLRDATDALAAYGLPICPVRIYQRQAYVSALTGGMAVSELDSKSLATAEIKALWKWIKKELKA